MKYRIIIFVCLICVLFIGFGNQPKPVAAVGNTYYVAKTGSDSNSGTFVFPWLTISHAALIVKAGDTVNIEIGTYNEQVVPAHSGTAGNWITYKNYNNEVVTIDGTGILISGTGLFFIDNLNYIMVSGLTIQNAIDGSVAAGIFIYGDCDHITLQNLTVYNTEISGIWAGSGWYYVSPITMTNLLIEGCTVHHTNLANNQEGISLNCISNFEVKNCTVYDMEYIQGAGICTKCGTSYGSIHDNEVYNCPDSPCIYVGTNSQSFTNISVYNNKVHDAGGTGKGITLADEQGLATMSNISIYNNLIYNNYRGFSIEVYDTETFNFSLINNTFYNNGDTEIYLVPSLTYFITCIIRNNILFSLATGSYGIYFSDYANGAVTVDHNLFYNSGGHWHSGNIEGTSPVVGNPLLMNPTSDFSLQSGSPAIDAGSATGVPSTDYIGTNRPQGVGFDIGAYEYDIISPVAPYVYPISH